MNVHCEEILPDARKQFWLGCWDFQWYVRAVLEHVELSGEHEETVVLDSQYGLRLGIRQHQRLKMCLSYFEILFFFFFSQADVV